MLKKILRNILFPLLICAVFVGVNPTEVLAVENEDISVTFSDVDGDAYYYDAVLWAVENSITNGVSKTKFGVGNECSRAQSLTFLWRVQGSEEPTSTENPFSDVPEDSYFYSAVFWGVEKKITSGVSETNFLPDATVTRAQFVTFLYRVAGSPEVAGENPFSDVQNNTYYKDAVLWAVEHGITSGVTENTFAPNTSCVREQAVTLMWRAYNAGAFHPDEINAVDYGLSEDNTGEDNSMILQGLIDEFSAVGGVTIYIPEGEYAFAGIGKHKTAMHCIKMQSDITIIGAGEGTVLKPEGESSRGIDMFYFNEYIDTDEPIYLKNCRFEDFVIDGENTSCDLYTSSGKGFMFNLFENCHWENVTVKNTNATGFGVDCPLGGSMVNCTAINCGTEALPTSPGAAGFGIGFGYSEEEHFQISNCKSYDNKTFGFFFEHQGKFRRDKYTAKGAADFVVENCEADGNYNNFGGLHAMDVTYEKCESTNALNNGFHFENSKDCKVLNCSSKYETEASYVIRRTEKYGGDWEVSNNTIQKSKSVSVKDGVILSNYDDPTMMKNNEIKSCSFASIYYNVVTARGPMESLTLTKNFSFSKQVSITSPIDYFVNENNSWNM